MGINCGLLKSKTTFWRAKHAFSLSVLIHLDRFLKLAGQMPSRPHGEGRAKVLLLPQGTSHLDSFLLQLHFHIHMSSYWHTGLSICLLVFALCQFLIVTVVFMIRTVWISMDLCKASRTSGPQILPLCDPLWSQLGTLHFFPQRMQG